jgi:hypothetical protein
MSDESKPPALTFDELTTRAELAQRAKADAHALNVLPIIQELQSTGVRGQRALARALNARGVPTAFGFSKWYHHTVRNLLLRAEAISQRKQAP